MTLVQTARDAIRLASGLIARPVLPVDVAGLTAPDDIGTEILTHTGSGEIADAAMTGNYSVTPRTWYAGPPAGERWHVDRLAVVMICNANIDLFGYGTGAALSADGRMFLERSRNGSLSQSIFTVATSWGWLVLDPASQSIIPGWASTAGLRQMLLASIDLRGQVLDGDTADRIQIRTGGNLSTLNLLSHFSTLVYRSHR